MEFIRVGENKLKLSLSEDEMRKYGIKREELSRDTTARRRALWTLLDEVKKQTGLDAAVGRTLIEAFPGKKEGCEIFVTVLSHTREVHTALYRFIGLDTLKTAASKLASLCPDGENASLYALTGEEYLLALKLPVTANARTPSPYSFLEEYGVREKNGVFHAYAKEYGVCLFATNAITRILAEKENFSV